MCRVGDVNSDGAANGSWWIAGSAGSSCTNDPVLLMSQVRQLHVFLVSQKKVSSRDQWSRLFEILATLVNLRPVVTKIRHSQVRQYT